ncbi:cilia- and flagella-associated protein 45-like [Halichondria panicea]|uniref:cilia- and flagella-associated protein 45-like n=1 Tax=Halichondria panicea TaxID=6063 RepID=UPI00312B42A5
MAMMPTSTTSLDCSVKSARSKYKKQKFKRKSAVDETLFGPPARLSQMTGNRSWGSSSTPSVSTSDGVKTRGQRVSNDPEVIQVISKDLIRKIKVPGTPDPSGFTVILDRDEFSKIRTRSNVLSEAEKKKRAAAAKEDKNTKLEAVQLRKQEMQHLEMTRKKNEKPSDLDQENQEMGSELLAKAKYMMEEQDDEVKKLNELILNAKCHAIRDAQLREKKEMERAMKDEELRLDDMMEIDRIKSLRDYEQKQNSKAQQRRRGAGMIREQIEDREQRRLLEAEKKDQETQSMLHYLERLQQEDMDNLVKKREAQASLMEDVALCNEEIQRQKLEQREQLKMEDIRVMEYIKEKQQREEEQQAEQEAAKAEKEKEIARLRAQQERANDKQAEKDALRAKRRHEEFERMWRKKEQEEARKKADTEHMLIDSRNRQIQNKEHLLAMQAQRDRTEFERVLQVQQELVNTDKSKQATDAQRRHAHAEEIRKQVRKKEEERIGARRGFFEEGNKLDQEAKDRRKKLDEIKQRKLAELRAAGIPDKYCAEVSRKITAPPASFTMLT